MNPQQSRYPQDEPDAGTTRRFAKPNTPKANDEGAEDSAACNHGRPTRHDILVKNFDQHVTVINLGACSHSNVLLGLLGSVFHSKKRYYSRCNVFTYTLMFYICLGRREWVDGIRWVWMTFPFWKVYNYLIPSIFLPPL